MVLRVDKHETGDGLTRKPRFAVDLRNQAVLRIGNKIREEILLYLPDFKSILTFFLFQVHARVLKRSKISKVMFEDLHASSFSLLHFHSFYSLFVSPCGGEEEHKLRQKRACNGEGVLNSPIGQ